MNLEETIELLAVAAAFDRRTVGKADAIAWHAALDDMGFADARTAVIAHYRDSRQWIMPADIRHRVREVRRIRLENTEIPPPPPELLDDPPAYRAWLRESARRIADGETPEPQPHEIGRRHLRGIEAS